jgi:hypothetical protein
MAARPAQPAAQHDIADANVAIEIPPIKLQVSGQRRQVEFLRRCGKISAGRTATAARGAGEALSAEFQFGSPAPELTNGAAFDGWRVLGRRLSIDRSWDVHTIRSDVGVTCVKRGYQR